MPDTKDQITRAVLLHSGLIPWHLADSWVQDTWKTICQRRPWSFLRKTAEIIISDQRSGTFGVTRGSTVITGVSVAFTSADLGRQFRTGTSEPPYTIIRIISATSAQLDRSYGSPTSASIAGTILDAFVTMPEDFDRFQAVLDPASGFGLRLWNDSADLNSRDPQRSSTGTPFALVPAQYSPVPGLEGRVRYELWPYSTSAYNYSMYYIAKASELEPDAYFKGPFQNRGDVIKLGALARCCAWPGTNEAKNPMFDLKLAAAYDEKFEKELGGLDARDEDIYPTAIDVGPFGDRASCPIDAKYAQSHDVGGGEWGDGW